MESGSRGVAEPGAEYDVIVVGAGPAGATTAYYLAESRTRKAGRAPRVALLEKAHFPRDKVCGDAWCAPALDILEDMGVLQQLEAEGLVRDARAGGFISPRASASSAPAKPGGCPGHPRLRHQAHHLRRADRARGARRQEPSWSRVPRSRRRGSMATACGRCAAATGDVFRSRAAGGGRRRHQQAGPQAGRGHHTAPAASRPDST